jgi:hypothetical protein
MASDQLSRSTKLRKYASVYRACIRKIEQSKIIKSPMIVRKPDIMCRARRNDEVKQVNKRKSLNCYQKFVKQESKKDKYKKLSGRDRLSVIAYEWKKINR